MRWLVFIMSLALLSVISIWAKADKAWVEKLARSVAQVTVIEDLPRRHAGTVFNLAINGHTVFITNAHVCGSSKLMHIWGELHRVVKLDPAHDLCAVESQLAGGLKLADSEPDYFHFKASGLPKTLFIGFVGDPTAAHVELGQSFGRVFFGKVIEGNSGSPLLNPHMEVIGVVFGLLDNTSEPMGLIIDLATLKEFTKNL